MTIIDEAKILLNRWPEHEEFIMENLKRFEQFFDMEYSRTDELKKRSELKQRIACKTFEQACELNYKFLKESMSTWVAN